MTATAKKAAILTKPTLSAWDTAFKNISTDLLAKDYVLAIFFSDDFFSYAISNYKSNKIIGTQYFKKTNLNNIINQITHLSKSYKQVKITYNPSQYTIIPDELFDAKLIKDYLKFNFQNPELDYVTFDSLKKCKSKLVYSMPKDIEKWINKNFPKAVSYHQNTALINKLLSDKNHQTKPIMHINISSFQTNIIVIQQNKLLFCNTFETKTIEEQVYFIAFTMEQLKLSPLSTKVIFSHLPDYDIAQIKLLFKYFNKPELADYNFNLSPQLNKFKTASFNNLYSLVACE